jgi:hypothetical protein
MSVFSFPNYDFDTNYYKKLDEFIKPMIKDPNIQWPKNSGCKDTIKTITLEPGKEIDRFGDASGFYFGDAGTSFVKRSLTSFASKEKNQPKMKEYYYTFYSEPNTDINPGYNYHLYKVLNPFDISSCTITGAFGFPGGAIQYWSDDKSVNYLLKNNFIEEVFNYKFPPLFDDEDKKKVFDYYKSQRDKSQRAGRKSRRHIHKSIKRKNKRRTRHRVVFHKYK